MKRRGEIRFSIFDLRYLRKLSHFPPGMTHFFIFTAKKELIFFFQMSPTRSLWDQYFSSYDFFNLFLFFAFLRESIFFINPNFRPFVTMKKSQHVTHIDSKFYDASFRVVSSGFFCHRYLAEFSPIFQVVSFRFLVCILKWECRKCSSINLRKY